MTEKWNGVWIISFLILVSTLAGCTQPYYGYPGPRLPETETALLVPDVGVKIYSINGHVVNIKHESESGLMKTTRAILRPGNYQLVLVPQHIKNVKRLPNFKRCWSPTGNTWHASDGTWEEAPKGGNMISG